MMTGNALILVKLSIAYFKDANSLTINKKMVMMVQALKYQPQIIPNLLMTHSVRTNPSGHFFLMIGPKNAKMNIGNEPANEYTNKPCKPSILAI